MTGIGPRQKQRKRDADEDRQNEPDKLRCPDHNAPNSVSSIGEFGTGVKQIGAECDQHRALDDEREANRELSLHQRTGAENGADNEPE